MQSLLTHHIDARQTPQWAQYLSEIDWVVEKVNGINIYIRPVPLLHHSIIKIQHSQGEIPFTQIDQIAKKHNALFVLIEPHSNQYSPESFKQNNYIPSKLKTSFTATRIINLQQTAQQLWKSFSENARRNIKKAQKNNLETKHIWQDTSDQTYLKQFYTLYELLGKNKKFYVLPYLEIQKKYNAFKDSSLLSFAYQPGNPNPIATVWYCTFNNILLYNHTGITQAGYDTLANYLLVWEAMQLAQQKNINLFDFESIYDPRYPKENRKWIGYSQFKSRFNGEEIHYPKPWIKIYNTPYKILYLWSTFFSSS